MQLMTVRTILLSALIISAGTTARAAAQDFRDNFPDIKTSSPHGVNLQSGQFFFTETDIKMSSIEVQRTYSGKYSNSVWSFSPTAYPSDQYADHPAFGIASNLRGYLHRKTETTPSLTVNKFVVHVEGKVLEFQISPSGTFRRWTVATKGWSLYRSGSDIMLKNKLGTVYRFVLHSGLNNPGGTPSDYAARLLSSVTAADGTTLDYEYNTTANLISVSSNRGERVNFQYNPTANRITACGFNLAVTYATSATSCASAAIQVHYDFGTSANGARQITSVTRADGTVVGYQFGTHMMTCIQIPDSSTCRITNEYWPLHSPTGGVSVGNSPDQVTRQILADGSIWNYEYDFSAFAGDAPPLAPRDLTPGNKRYTTGAMIDPLERRTQVDFLVGFPEILWEPTGKTVIDHTGVNFNLVPVGGTSATPFSYTHFSMVPTGIENPEGDRLDFGYDDAGNNLWQRSTAKPGGSEPAIIVSRSYPTAVPYATYSDTSICYSVPTVLCGRPTSQTDALGNQTTYSYDTTHGGVLTETGPAVGGVQPQTRYTYVQRNAMVKNSGGGFVAATPAIWLPASKSTCKTGAASGAGCAIPGDEVTTTYDYGPTTGANNLLLRGMVEDATGPTPIRTCYTYDALGNRLSETKPAPGTSCP